MYTINVAYPTGSYPIYLGENVLNKAGEYLAELGHSGRCAVVTNPTVGRHHAEPLLDSLNKAGFNPTRIDISDGEQFKTLDTVRSLYDKFIAAKLDRRSPVIALGGGVLGDTAGFAAASFLRGVPFVQIPTTILSLVDAGVGGKTGVDMPQGKNLVGAFKQPEVVIMDPTVLSTLPATEYRSGMAEVVKHGILEATELFAALEAGGTGDFPQSLLPASYPLTQMLHDAVSVKIRIVQEDPFEQGRRAALNLGHTFGHTFEQLSNFKIRHGEGVAMGIVCAARLATRLGYCSGSSTERILTLIEKIGLPTRHPPYPAEQIWATMFTDKKRAGNTIRFILPRDIGDVDIFDDVQKEDVIKILKG